MPDAHQSNSNPLTPQYRVWGQDADGDRQEGMAARRGPGACAAAVERRGGGVEERK